MMRQRFAIALASIVCGSLLNVSHSRASDLPLDVCNLSSFATDIAIGLEVSTGAATQGWFRVLPGQCREILKQGLNAKRHLVHARTLPLYGTPPETEAGALRLCIRDEDFVISGATECARDGQFMAEFVAVEPIETNARRRIEIDEPAGYDSEHAATAGMQRLLGLAGYDVGIIDGVSGSKTSSALAAFRNESGFDASEPSEYLTALIEQILAGHGSAAPQFCNETLTRVMLSVGIPVGRSTESRGWFQIEPGECARPTAFAGVGESILAFAEAVDSAGAALISDGQPIAWGGSENLCTKNLEFRIRNHENCERRGLTTRGYNAYKVPEEGALIVTFTSPEGS